MSFPDIFAISKNITDSRVHITMQRRMTLILNDPFRDARRKAIQIDTAWPTTTEKKNRSMLWK
jgi:hypothetical protein